MAWTNPSAGQTLTAAKLAELATYAVPLSVAKAATTARNTTATCTADPELALVIPASSTYDYVVDALVSSAANAAGDFRIRMAWTNTASVTFWCAGLDQSLASSVTGTWNGAGAEADSTSPTAENTFGASTAVSGLRFHGRIVTGGSSVTLSVEWAQQASNANNTSLHAGSKLTATRHG